MDSTFPIKHADRKRALLESNTPSYHSPSASYPLPPHWRQCYSTKHRAYYFANTKTKITTWMDPRDKLWKKEKWDDYNPSKPKDLPFGWDKKVTKEGLEYFVDHINGKNTFTTGNKKTDQNLPSWLQDERNKFLLTEKSKRVKVEEPQVVLQQIPLKEKEIEAVVEEAPKIVWPKLRPVKKKAESLDILSLEKKKEEEEMAQSTPTLKSREPDASKVKKKEEEEMESKAKLLQQQKSEGDILLVKKQEKQEPEGLVHLSLDEVRRRPVSRKDREVIADVPVKVERESLAQIPVGSGAKAESLVEVAITVAPPPPPPPPPPAPIVELSKEKLKEKEEVEAAMLETMGAIPIPPPQPVIELAKVPKEQEVQLPVAEALKTVPIPPPPPPPPANVVNLLESKEIKPSEKQAFITLEEEKKELPVPEAMTTISIPPPPPPPPVDVVNLLESLIKEIKPSEKQDVITQDKEELPVQEAMTTIPVPPTPPPPPADVVNLLESLIKEIKPSEEKASVPLEVEKKEVSPPSVTMEEVKKELAEKGFGSQVLALLEEEKDQSVKSSTQSLVFVEEYGEKVVPVAARIKQYIKKADKQIPKPFLKEKSREESVDKSEVVVPEAIVQQSQPNDDAWARIKKLEEKLKQAKLSATEKERKVEEIEKEKSSLSSSVPELAAEKQVLVVESISSDELQSKNRDEAVNRIKDLERRLRQKKQGEKEKGDKKVVEEKQAQEMKRIDAISKVKDLEARLRREKETKKQASLGNILEDHKTPIESHGKALKMSVSTERLHEDSKDLTPEERFILEIKALEEELQMELVKQGQLQNNLELLQKHIKDDQLIEKSKMGNEDSGALEFLTSLTEMNVKDTYQGEVDTWLQQSPLSATTEGRETILSDPSTFYQTLKKTVKSTQSRNHILANIEKDATSMVSNIVEGPNPNKIPQLSAKNDMAKWIQEVKKYGEQAEKLRQLVIEKAIQKGGEGLTFKEKLLFYMGDKHDSEDELQKSDK